CLAAEIPAAGDMGGLEFLYGMPEISHEAVYRIRRQSGFRSANIACSGRGIIGSKHQSNAIHQHNAVSTIRCICQFTLSLPLDWRYLPHTRSNSSALKPTVTRCPSLTRGLLISMPLEDSNAICSSRDIPGSLSFNPSCRYTSPD